MTREDVKKMFYQTPVELTREQLSILFGIYSFQIKEYYRSEQKVMFEIHFQRTFIINIEFPIEKGLMSLNNDFVNFGEDTHRIAMGRSAHTLDLLLLILGMFQDTLLAKARHHVYYREELSPFQNEEEHIKMFEFSQELLIKHQNQQITDGQ